VNNYSRLHRVALRSMLAVMAALLVIAPGVHAAQDAGRDIVVRVAKDGAAFTVSAEMTVQATADEVWSVLVDFDNMARILSNVDDSRIANRNGDKFEVIQKSHAFAGPIRLSTDSVRQVELTPKKEMRSHLVKGDLKASDFVTRMNDEGNVVKVTVSGKFVAGGFTASVVTPEIVEAQTRRQYQELREEIMRRKTNEPTPPCLLAKNCPQ
jgi:uncharacterized membrane protein